MNSFLQQLQLAAPLFILVLAGYLLAASGRWPKSFSNALARFVFSIAIPALLFRLMSDMSRLPAVDARLLIAYFGGSFIVFALGRLLGAWLYKLNGAEQSVFALGGIFANNVLLGIPLAKIALGEASLPSIALVLVFNSLTMWMLVTVSVEWARHGSLSPRGFLKAARGVITNPIILAIFAGAIFGLAGGNLPHLIDAPLRLLAESAAPLALMVLGMGLAEYGVRRGWRVGLGITVVKIVVQPLIVLLLAWAIDLPLLQTQVVVLLAALPGGVNVYLMAREFDVIQGPVAASLVISTVVAAVTVPLWLSTLGAG